MAYALSGEFFEACDCEVVCSCWAGVPPVMGTCTGLFAWHISNGTVDGVNVSGSSAALLFNGSSCDQASHVLLLVQATTAARRQAVEAAISSGPWSDVVRLDAAVVMPPSVHATITASSLGGNRASLKVTAPAILAEAFCRTEGFRLQAGPTGSLIRRATGTATPHSIEVGRIYTDLSSGSGLNLLAANTEPHPYTFDLDITDVSAVSGKFSYALA
jgi:hypothetical protein